MLTEKKNGTVVNAMTYDNYGNIKSKNGVAYTYGNSSWKDLLTKVGNQTITYDAQGNPTSYLGHTLTWEKGRQLKSFDTNTYTYNANGIRTSKTINGVKHTYVLDGTKILKETWGNNTIVPLYDNEDSVCGIEYNGTAYWFYKNLQGDIISIANADGDVIAKYTYDAWGACTVAEDTSEVGIATVNSFRYRGYYYDTEIGMYYLQSRYYDPNVGRFVNADDGVFTSNAVISNLFCYCLNEPVSCSDSEGRLRIVISSTVRSIVNLVGKVTSHVLDKLALSMSLYIYSTITSQSEYTRNFSSDDDYYCIGKLMKKRLYDSLLIDRRWRSYAKNATRVGSTYCNTEPVSFGDSYKSSFNSTELDLFLSIGSANNCKVTVENRGKTSRYSKGPIFKISVRIIDRYDFDKMGKEKNILLRAINNYLGYYPMQRGVVKTFWWMINYTFFKQGVL